MERLEKGAKRIDASMYCGRGNHMDDLVAEDWGNAERCWREEMNGLPERFVLAELFTAWWKTRD